MPTAVRVLVDEPAIDREFSYLLPPKLAAGRVPVQVGTIVRVALKSRRLRGWVTGLDGSISTGRELVPISSVVGMGPPAHVVELASWAAWRWAGTRAHFLRMASSDRVVSGSQGDELSNPQPPQEPELVDNSVGNAKWFAAAFVSDPGAPAVVRLGPCADEWPLVGEAVRRGRALLLTPTASWSARLAGKLRQAGVATALMPRDWAAARSAHAVVGTRSAAWAPCGRLDSVLVLDEHDEGYQSEAAPTWNARDLVVERARRDGAACVLIGPMPSTDALKLTEHGRNNAPRQVITAPRACERAAWPRVQVADRRQDDPATGEWCGEALSALLRTDASIVCVLNRTGRARLAYCASCGELVCSPHTGRPLRLEAKQFVDLDSGDVRPAVCESCGAMKFRRARVGVKGVAEELERLALRPAIQIVGNAAADVPDDAAGRESSANTRRRSSEFSPSRNSKPPLYIGTEAALHRVPSADVVAFLDFDQELTAPRYRAGEEAFALVVRAARLLNTRAQSAHILVQSRLPNHPVLRALVEANPSDWIQAEAARRQALGLPPMSTWALVSGSAASTYVERLAEAEGAHLLEISEAKSGSASHTWRIRSSERTALLDVLQRTPRPSGRLRVQVDPMRA